jgi:hypothetical protein
MLPTAIIQLIADYGFCQLWIFTSQNSNRNESITTGHVMPAIKPNSTEPEIHGAFIALTTFASNTRPLRRPDKSHFALIGDANLTEFAQKQLIRPIHALSGHIPTINLVDGGA